MSVTRAMIALLLCSWLAPTLAQQPDALKSWNEWKAERVAGLTDAEGWLTLVGLLWLKEGDNSFGRAAANTLTLDHPALPATLGKFVRHGDKVRFIAAPGSVVTNTSDGTSDSAGHAITEVDLITDAAEEPTELATGSLRFYVIERVGRYGVRIRDVDHPARRNFKGLDYFPYNADAVVAARFEPYVPVKKVPILNVVGSTDQMESPGAVVFNFGGKTVRLDALRDSSEDDELFLIFIDQTSPRESYGAGRYLYTSLPKDGVVQVDFNRAYNPPCAFSDFATCPLPPKQNRLPVRIEAGEKKYLRH